MCPCSGSSRIENGKSARKTINHPQLPFVASGINSNVYAETKMQQGQDNKEHVYLGFLHLFLLS